MFHQLIFSKHYLPEQASRFSGSQRWRARLVLVAVIIGLVLLDMSFFK